MKQVFIGVVLAILFYSCEKTESASYSLGGTYMGMFSRTGMDTTQVSLFFDQNRFNGKSSRANYPAVCAGTFLLEDNTIQFRDTCAWTANFDWSLILSGSYNISISDGTVRIWKTNGAITDEYLLRQPTR